MKTTALRVIASAILCLLIWSLPLGSAAAASPAFTTSITYQNIGSDVAHVTITYIPDGGVDPVALTQPDLPIGASQTVILSSLDPSTAGSRGSVRIKSDVEIAILASQVPVSTTIVGRGLSTASQAGSSQAWLPYLAKAAGVSTMLALQNQDVTDADLRVTFYGAASPVVVERLAIPAGASTYIDLADISALGTSYTGTALVTAVQSGTTNPGRVNGSALTSTGVSTEVFSTESVAAGGSKLYMPLALCYGMGGMSTTYYVFNTDASQSANVLVTYSGGKTDTANLPALSGRSFNACTPSGVLAGYSGSAVITSSGPGLIAVGRIKLLGMAATFYGQASGASRLAIPSAIYSTAGYSGGQKYRTQITVMNLGANLAAGAVKAKFYGKDGALIGTYSLPAINNGSRQDVNAAKIGSAGAEFGYYSDGSIGGSVVIEGPAGSSLMAVAWQTRVAGSGTYAGEAYNAIPITSQ
jgi:hypothetical protein